MRKLIAVHQEDPGVELYDLGNGRGVVVVDGAVKGNDLPIASILAHGYWDLKETPSELPVVKGK